MERDEYRRMFEQEDRYWWFLAKHALVRSMVEQYATEPAARPDRPLPGLEHRAVALDVGCGTGGTLHALSPLGGVWIGADRSEVGLAYARKRGLPRLLQASAEALPMRSGSVDLLLCLDVLYHRAILDDRRAVAECFRVLKPGGTVVITDSALPWLYGPHDEAVHARTRYRRDELADLVGGSGLQIVRKSYMNTLLFLPMTGYRLLRRWLPGQASGSDVVALPRPLQALLSGIMRAERWMLGWTDLPIGTSIVVVARKP